MLLSEAFDTYLLEVIQFTNQSPKTAESNELVRKCLIKILGDIEVSDLNFEHIVKFKKCLEDRELAPNTIRLYILGVRRVLRHLQKRGYKCLQYDSIPIPKRQRTLPKAVDPEIVIKMLSATSLLRNKLIISLLYSSGARLSELCNLDISDIRDNKFTVYGKGGKYRICYLDLRSKEYLKMYLKTRNDNNPALIIGNTGKRIRTIQVQEIFKYVRKAAKIQQPVSPHCMRHSYATNLLKNGCHLYTLSRLMGHESPQTTAQYLTLEDNELEEAYYKYHKTS